MFNFPTITLTGLTHEDQISKAISLSKRYSFVEWAILFSPTRIGGRYAKREFIVYNENLQELPRKAVHLCGQAVTMFMEGDPVITNMLDIGIHRVQLNFNHTRMPIDLQRLSYVMEQYPTITFITQHNSANKDVYKTITALNHALLFDQSGGAGVTPDTWNMPIDNKLCGYAGGLGPDNIGIHLKTIQQLTGYEYEVWLDMETNLRTNDILDFNKCERVLEIVQTQCGVL